MTRSFIPGLGVQQKSCCRLYVWWIPAGVSSVTNQLIKFRTQANPLGSVPKCAKSKQGLLIQTLVQLQDRQTFIQISRALLVPSSDKSTAITIIDLPSLLLQNSQGLRNRNPFLKRPPSGRLICVQLPRSTHTTGQGIKQYSLKSFFAQVSNCAFQYKIEHQHRRRNGRMDGCKKQFKQYSILFLVCLFFN